MGKEKTIRDQVEEQQKIRIYIEVTSKGINVSWPESMPLSHVIMFLESAKTTVLEKHIMEQINISPIIKPPPNFRPQ